MCHRYIVNNTGCVVTKLQFSQLFSQAWFKAIHPETIINGFRKTGVCPVNKHAIEIVEEAEDSISESQSMDILSTSSTPAPAGCNDSPSTSFGQSDFNSSSLVTNDLPFGESAAETLSPIHAFNTDQIEKFQKRVDNGYNLFVEKDFVAWLWLYHPHYLPSDILHDEEHHPSGSESVRDENELTTSSDLLTPVSSHSPTVS